jgi:PKD repeat protein
MYALAGGGHGLEYPALSLYGQAADSSSRFDVTQGGNDACGGVPEPECDGAAWNSAFGEHASCEGTTECTAAPGFDGPSGVGTPIGLGLFEAQLPTAVITPPALPAPGVSASFSAAGSSDPYPGGSVKSATWNWGDGDSSDGVSAAHTYAKAGTYTVTLTVTDSYGLDSAPSKQSLDVFERTPAEEAAAKLRHEEEVAAAEHEEEAAVKPEHGGEAHLTGPPAGSTTTTASGTQQVENFQVQAAGAPDAKLASTALTASAGGAVSIKLSCQAGGSSCKGTVTLTTLTAVSASASSAKRKAILTLASGSFSVAAGKTTTVTLHLSSRARSLLARLHVLRLAATIVARDSAGTTHTTKRTVTLREAKARRGKH